MSALDRLAAVTAEFAHVRSDLDATLGRVIEHSDRHAVGTLCADVQNIATYLLPSVVRDQLMLAHREIALHESMSPPRIPPIQDESPSDLLNRVAETTRRWVDQGDVERQEQYRRELQALHDERPAVSGRFILGFKQAYFTIRALQDVLYRVAITITEGTRPGSYAGMKRALNNEKNPVQELLGADADAYFAWFARWRDLRDGVKLGRGTSIAGPGALGPHADVDDYGIGLTRVGSDGGLVVEVGSEATHVSGVVDALRHTRRLMVRIADVAKARAVR